MIQTRSNVRLKLPPSVAQCPADGGTLTTECYMPGEHFRSECHTAEMMDDQYVEAIFERYRSHYGWNLQGCCLLIAEEIIDAIGGEAVAGELTWYGGSCRRSHWWVEKDGRTIDPMGDAFLASEEAPGREEHHRDQAMFQRLLPQYERWRVT